MIRVPTYSLITVAVAVAAVVVVVAFVLNVFVLVELYTIVSVPQTLIKNLTKHLVKIMAKKHGPQHKTYFGKAHFRSIV